MLPQALLIQLPLEVAVLEGALLRVLELPALIQYFQRSLPLVVEGEEEPVEAQQRG